MNDAGLIVTSLARSSGSAVSPFVSGFLLQGLLLALGLHFVIAGVLKVAYDLTLWATFRRVPVAPPLPRAGDPKGSET